MNEEDVKNENPAAEPSKAESVAASAANVVAQIDSYTKKADEIVEKALGIVANHPWEDWLKTANEKIALFLPGIIAVMGVLGTIIGLVTSIKMDLPFSMVIGNLGYLVLAIFSMHLAPRAMSLPRSFVDKKEADAVRPELLYILKVLLGLGGFVLAIVSLLTFTAEGLVSAIVLLFFAVLFTIVFANPAMIGVKAGYPSNNAEETITLILLPIKILFVLLTPIIAIGTVAALVIGICKLFSSGLEASLMLVGGAALPLVLPLAVYVIYLISMFWLELFRAIVSLPRKLEGIADKVSK